MTLTYRSTAGRRLTVTEGDGNIAHLAAADGITFVQSGTGATATRVQTKIRNAVAVDVKSDFGAVGDGVTDDTAAIQAAFDSFTSATGGGLVYIPPGTYLVSSTLILDVTGMYIYGVTGRTTLKRKNSVAADTMNIMQTSFEGRYAAAPITDVTIYGITFDGNKANNSIGSDDNYDHCLVGFYTDRMQVRNCVAKNAGRLGIAFTTGADDCVIEGCDVYDCDEGGIYSEVSENTRFIGNYLEGCSASPFNIGAICFNNITNGTIAGNVVKTGRDGIYIRNECSGCSIVGNTCKTQTRYGIWVYDESEGVAPDTPIHTTITGNTVVDSGDSCVRLQFANDTVVSGNNLDSAHEYCVEFNNCARLKISGNDLSGFSVAPILDVGGNSGLTIYGVSGTYTPILTGAGAAGAGTYSIQVGRYEYAGNRVLFDAVITWSAHTGTGQLRFSLPLTVHASSNATLRIDAYNLAYTDGLAAFAVGSAAYARLHQNSGGTLSDYAVQGAGTIFLSGAYEINGS